MIERLDMKTSNDFKVWTTIDLKMKNSSALSWICLEGCGLHTIEEDKILIFGGFTSSDQKSNQCFIFDPYKNEIDEIEAKT